MRQTIDHEVIAPSVYGFAALAMLPIILKYETNRLPRWVSGIALSIMLLVALPMSLPLELPLVTRYPALVFFNFVQIFVRTGPCIAHLGGSPAFHKRFEKRMQQIKNENKLPEIKGAMDIYPVMSNVAIAHNYDYRPRPVFQSYLAYQQPLTRINKDHLDSIKAAPTVVIQSLKDCYGYYPTLYDGPSWPALITHYEPVSCHPAGLVLKKRMVGLKSVLTKVSDKTFKIGETINVDQSDGKIIFAEIDSNLSIPGWLQKLFYRIRPLAIDVVLKDGSKKHFIAPSEIMKAGFILSPFVLTPEETNKLCQLNLGGLNSNEVSSLTISETKNELPWNVFSSECKIRLYQLSTTETPSQ